MKRNYPTDLTDAEWECIEPFIPAPKCRGRQRIHSPREILNAVFLHLEKWMSLAVASPRVPTLEDRLPLLPRVEDQRHLRETQRDVLRERLRSCLGRSPQPSAGIADSQSAKTTGVGGENSEALSRCQEGSRQGKTPTSGHRGIGP